MLDFFHWFVRDAREWVTASSQAHPYWVFPIAAVIAFSESFIGLSFLIPATILLISLGTVIGATHIGMVPAVAGAIVGSVIGDSICWWVGFHYHHKIVHFALFRRFEAEIEKGLHFFHRWGIWGIFIGRFMGPFRATVPLVAGMSELEFRPFMIANTISAVIWAYTYLAFPAFVARHLLT